MNDHDRRTDRTTEALRVCIARAKEGDTVLYIAPHRRFFEHIIGMDVIRESGGVAKVSERCVTFEGGGRIMFDAPDGDAERYRGMGKDRFRVDIDHAADGGRLMTSLWDYGYRLRVRE